MTETASQSARIIPGVGSKAIGTSLLLLGVLLFIARTVELWHDPYEVGRVWQSFDIAQELERVHYLPWLTEISTMSGGTKPAPFLQEFPAAQYATCLVRKISGLPLPKSGQLIYSLIAAASVAAWLRYSWLLPVALETRLLVSGTIFFVPAFLRFGGMAVPDALVFLTDLAGGILIVRGRRESKNRLVAYGAALVGAATLLKAPALIPAAVIGITLLAQKYRRAAFAMLATATLGILWAGLASVVNRSALPVNEFARLGALRDWWWNPQLYVDTWWFRNLTFGVYDSLGAFGIVFLLWIAMTFRRRRKVAFEYTLLLVPAIATFISFNFHSASHPYYALIWLPFTLLGAVELALKTAPANVGGPLSPLAAGGVIACLAILSIAEREIGGLERAFRKPTNGPRLLRTAILRPNDDRRTQLARSALLMVRDQAHFVAYLGDDVVAFTDLRMRGWLVEAPHPNERKSAEASRHVPKTVLAEEEWRKIDAQWFRERMDRGLDAVLIEHGGGLDNPETVESAKAAGLQEDSQPPEGYTLLTTHRL